MVAWKSTPEVQERKLLFRHYAILPTIIYLLFGSEKEKSVEGTL